MAMNEIHYAIRSYKRAGAVTTLKLFPDASVWVPESQGDAYRKYYGELVVTIPDKEDGNPARKFNAVLNRAPSDHILILDDDVTEIAYFEGGSKYLMTAPDLRIMVEHYFGLADQLGVHLWGINQNSDPMAYRVYSPIAFLSPVLGPFTGHIRTELRYDETIPLKEDYDYWLQNIARDHMTLRVNKYHYEHGHADVPGGLSGMRTMELEKKCAARMLAKWGPKVFRQGGGNAGGFGKAGQNILNSKVHVPIAGI